MSFLSQPKPFKLKNTYIHGFLDCSGYVILNSGNLIIGNTTYPGYNANQLSLLVNGRTEMNGNVIVNGNLFVSSNNIALGLRAGNITNGIQDGVPNGLNTTAVGSFSGMNHTGLNNTFIGSVAGQTSSTTYFSRTGSNNTYVGYRTSANNSAWENSTALGTGAVITASNQIVLGTATETIFAPGNVIIERDISCNGNVLFSNNNIINIADIPNISAYSTITTRQTLGATEMRWLAMSYTGQHIAVINTAATDFNVYVSNDFGTTFTSRASIGYTTASGSVAVSATGKNMVAMSYAAGTTQTYWYSKNFGATWTQSAAIYNTSNFSPTITQPSLYVNDNGIIYFSNTTSAYSLIIGLSTLTLFSNNGNGQSIAASSDGKYILSTNLTTAASVSNNNGAIFSNTNQMGINAAVSGNGKYMLLLNSTIVVLSSNYGVTWANTSLTTVTANTTYFTISYNGQEMIAAGGTSIYYSLNYGVSWTTLTTSFVKNTVLSGDGTKYTISYSTGNNQFGTSTGTLINATSLVKEKQIRGFMDVSCGMIQPSYILNKPIIPTDDMYGSFLQLTGSVNLFQLLPTPVISSRRSAEITIWNNSSVTQTITTSQGYIIGFSTTNAGSIDILPADRIKLRSDGYNWINCESAYAPRLSYTAEPDYTVNNIGYSTTITGTGTIAAAFNALNTTSATGVSIPVAGVWLINYTGAINKAGFETSAAHTIGFGLSTTASNNSNTIALGTTRAVVARGNHPASSNIYSLHGTYIYIGASTTIYLNCNITTITELAAALCSLTLTRIA